MRWYITVAAVHDFQRILGLAEEPEGPLFDRVAKQLDRITDDARLAKDEGHRQLWLVKATLRGKRERLELTVVPGPRAEGPLPQLVRVRLKGGGRT